jgi:hypothetical protein
MVDLNIKYSDTITILKSEDKGFLMRLWIVLAEEGLPVTDFVNNTITATGLVSLDRIREIINEQFNPKVINICIE